MSLETAPFLQLTTPLADPVIVTQFTGHEALSALFCLQISLLSSNQAITPNDLLTKTATLQINHGDNTVRYYNGIISRLQSGDTVKNMRQYEIEIVPALWQLDFTSDCQTFSAKTVIEIVKTICQPFHIALDTSNLQRNYQPRPYCVQYNETHLHFIQRLLQEEGIFFFFQHKNDAHILMLCDNNNAFKSIPQKTLAYRTDKDNYRDYHISLWLPENRLYSGVCIQNDYNYLTPSISLLSQQTSTAKFAAAKKFSLYHYPGGYQTETEGKSLAQNRFTAEETEHQVMQGISNCSYLSTGSKFTLQNHSSQDQNQDYFITKTTYYGYDTTQSAPASDQPAQYYSNNFHCVPFAVNYRPLYTLVKPMLAGHQTAMVVGNGEIDVDDHGRICVQFPWDRQHKTSTRIRVSQNLAGQGWGSYSWPRVGHEVIVSFEQGDPDRPIVTGSAYNGNNTPAYALPENSTKTGIKTRSSRNGTPDQCNELHFEDHLGNEEIYLHAQKDHTRIIENNENVTIKQGNQIIHVAAGKSLLQAAQQITLKVSDSKIVINTQGVFVNGQQLTFNK